MDPELAGFLRRCVAAAEESAVWGNGALPLRIVGYLGVELPPSAYVTSVRALLFRGDLIMVVQDPLNEVHIIPGGRCEPGETLEETLRRELLEETEWTLGSPSLLGFMHLHHLSPKPPGHAYPHPDFLQVIYVAEAEAFVPGAGQPDEWVLSSGFRPVSEAQALVLSPVQHAFLAAALRKRAGH